MTTHRWKDKPPGYLLEKHRVPAHLALMTDAALQRYKTSLDEKIEENSLVHLHMSVISESDPHPYSEGDVARRVLRKFKSASTHTRNRKEMVDKELRSRCLAMGVRNAVVEPRFRVSRLDFEWRGTRDHEALRRWLAPNWQIRAYDELTVQIEKTPQGLLAPNVVSDSANVRFFAKGERIPACLML